MCRMPTRRCSPLSSTSPCAIPPRWKTSRRASSFSTSAGSAGSGAARKSWRAGFSRPWPSVDGRRVSVSRAVARARASRPAPEKASPSCRLGGMRGDLEWRRWPSSIWGPRWPPASPAGASARSASWPIFPRAGSRRGWATRARAFNDWRVVRIPRRSASGRRHPSSKNRRNAPGESRRSSHSAISWRGWPKRSARRAHG